VCYSDAVEGEEQGKDFQFGERVSVDLFKRHLGVNNFDFYTCGPPPMMESITKGLQEWGVPDSRIHYEAFGPATVKKVANPAAAPAADGPALEVKFVNSNRSVNWTSASSSILELAEANGIKIDSGCRAGNCGSCVTTVRSGEVDYPSGKPGFDVEKGCCLACVAVPKSGTALALDA
jgi:ferredoxin